MTRWRTPRRLLPGGLAVVLTGCIPPGVPDGGTARYPAPAAPSPAPAPPRAAFQTAAAPVAQLPAPRPAWEARPVTPDATIVAAQTYTVRSGDTLAAIAERTGASAAAIARANALAQPYLVVAGQTLSIPGGRYHRVHPGETGIAIARAYGVPWSQMVAANDLVEPFILRAGQRILIPSAAPDRASSAAERAAAFRLDVDSILTGGEPAVAANQPATATPTPPPRPRPGAATPPPRALPATTPVVAPAAAPGRFVWPVSGQVVRRFGAGASGERSDGIKIAVPLNTPVKSIADGTVAYAGDGIAALGGLVIIRHGGGWTSVYGHAAKLLVRRGDPITRGQTIALSGASGYADRPELHFELRRGRTPVDPTAQLPRR